MSLGLFGREASPCIIFRLFQSPLPRMAAFGSSSKAVAQLIQSNSRVRSDERRHQWHLDKAFETVVRQLFACRGPVVSLTSVQIGSGAMAPPGPAGFSIGFINLTIILAGSTWSRDKRQRSSPQASRRNKLRGTGTTSADVAALPAWANFFSGSTR